MVTRWRAARDDPWLAAEALLALMGVTAPTQNQQVGALLVSEFGLRVIHALERK